MPFRSFLPRVTKLMLVTVSLALVGCSMGPAARLFVKDDRTTYETPAVRIEQAYAIAEQGRDAEAAQQEQLLADLARRLQNEPDPLVREALARAAATFPQPLAGQMLAAGLGDPDAGVRTRCCELLGYRGEQSAVAALTQAAAQDDDVDVRIAATQALGGVASPAAVRAIALSLEDSDPAMQFAGVQAMQKATGQDFGGDVQAYLAYARNQAPATQVATKPTDDAKQ